MLNQTTKQVVEAKKDRRSGKGRYIALSRRIYRLLQTDLYYVESESTDNLYYYVKFKPDIIEFCSCKDYESNRAQKCKHLFSIEYAIKFATVKDTDKLPEEANKKKRAHLVVTPETAIAESYIEDDYSF